MSYSPPIPYKFNVRWYLYTYPDVNAYRVVNSLPEDWAWDHYVNYGLWEGRYVSPFPDPSAFCRENYLKVYKDVAAAGIDPWEHFKNFGFAEGRLSCPEVPIGNLSTSFPANWCFAPRQYGDCLFFPVSNNGGSEHGGSCFIYKWDCQSWTIDYTMTSGTEDISQLIESFGRLYGICETYKYLPVKIDVSSPWIPAIQSNPPYPSYVKTMGPKETKYGAFQGAVCKDRLYVPISGYNRSSALVLFVHDGATWNPLTSWQADNERPTGWACESDGESVFVGIGGFGRGLNDNCRFDGIWKIEPTGDRFYEKPGLKAQSFCRLPNGNLLAGDTGGRIYSRDGGLWNQLYNTGCTFVCSMEWIDNTLWIGGDDPARIIKTKDFINYETVKAWGSGNASVGNFNNRPIVSHYENGRACIEAV